MKVFLPVLALALVASSSFGVAQSGAPRWQYAYLINGVGEGVTIAYADTNGCRYEPPVWETPAADNPREHTRAFLNSVARAVQTLGQDGWEMVGQGVAYCHNNLNPDSTIHFKRRVN